MLDKKEAMYYEKFEKENKVQCNLCPHKCTIEDGKVGLCKVRKNEEGTLYSLNYGKLTSYAYDPIEKKPLYHFKPGSKIFSIGSYGCNFNCQFCQNWEIAHGKTLTVEITDEDILKLAKANNSVGIAYTYNEPTIWYEYLLHLSKMIKNAGLLNTCITNGYINAEPLEELLPFIDAFNIDLKAMNNNFYNKICKARLEPVLQTIERVAKDTHVEVTTLLIEGKNDDLTEIEELSKYLSNIDKNIPLHINRYYPSFKMNLPPTSYDRLVEAKSIADKYLNYVYIGNVWGVDNNTYCPNCNTKLIQRCEENEIESIENGKCVKCDYPIKIIY